MSGGAVVFGRSLGLTVLLLAAAHPGAGWCSTLPAGPAPPALPAASGPGVEGVAALRGELVAGVVVLAFAGPGPTPAAVPVAVSAGTDGGGRYRLALKPGSYHLLAVKSAGAPWPFRGAKDDLFSYYLGNPVVVEPGRMTRVGFNMVRVGAAPHPAAGEGSGVAGQVLFEGKPLGRAYVHVFSEAGGNFRGLGLAAIPAGEDGRFRIKVPPGSYYLIARKRRGGGMYGPPGKDDAVGYYPGNPVTVRPGAFSTLVLETTTRIDLLEELWGSDGKGAGWFEGTVAEAGGKAAAGLYVLFYTDEARSGMPAFVAGPTDARGRFKVRAAAGKFHLLARSNLGGPLEAGEWYGESVLSAAGPPAGGVRISVDRYRGK